MDFLTNFVAPLQDEKVGLVNCFYRLANPVNLAMRYEAVSVNADFWSQVLQSKSLKPMDFALRGHYFAAESAQLAGLPHLPTVSPTITNWATGSSKKASASSFARSWWNVGMRPASWSGCLETSSAGRGPHPGLPAAALFFSIAPSPPPVGVLLGGAGRHADETMGQRRWRPRSCATLARDCAGAKSQHYFTPMIDLFAGAAGDFDATLWPVYGVFRNTVWNGAGACAITAATER